MSPRFRQKARFVMPPEKARKPISRKWLWFWVAVLFGMGAWAAVFNFPIIWNETVSFVNAKTQLELPRYEPRGFRLGLDLLGGSELVYEADLKDIKTSSRDEAMEGVRDVIERRVNALGVSEPVVQVVNNGDTHRVVIELAGIKDINQAIKVIGETPVLEFKEQGEKTDPKAQAAYDKELSKASDLVKKIELKLTNFPRRAFSDLAKDFNLSTEDKTLTKANDGELWQWASEHSAIGQRTKKAIETDHGWYFIDVAGSTENGKEVEVSHILICWQGATHCTSDQSKDDARKKIEDLKTQVTAVNFTDLAKQNSTEPGADKSGGSLGWFSAGQMVKPFEDAVFAMKVGDISDIVETQFGFHIIYKTGERPLMDFSVHEILVAKPHEPQIQPWVNTGLSGKDLSRAQVQFDNNTGQPTVALTFNDEGQKLFGDLTARSIGKPIAIFLDGAVISAPTVQSEIRSGDAIITGNFDVAEAKLLAQRLNAGALPVPIKLVSQQTVGATLGQDSLNKSLFAGLIGFALVALFMILYYRLSGIISVLALLIYSVFVLAIFKLVPVTMTLAGIAGFILSLGMAVDANVLIFERLKEELAAGRTLSSALDEAFRRAWPSIRDGNYTTIISAIVLFWFSSSVIRGFALTLGIGVLMSMFSAITVSRAFLQLVAAWRWRDKTGLFAPFIKRANSQ